MNPFDLTGKVAIVTGASTGLGQGIALALAGAGADIVGVDYVEMQDTQAQITAMGRKFLGLVENLMTIEPCQRIIDTACREMGQVNILVNNAGIIRREDAIDFTEKDWDDVMSINIKTVFFLSQAFARRVIEQKSGGKIISIASMLSFQGGIRVPSYASSKSAVMGLTRSLCTEWAKHNIQVNAIAPGYMSTNNTQAIREDEKRNADILARIPAGRWGVPYDVGGPAVFLASAASDYVNGYTVAVDGGWLAR